MQKYLNTLFSHNILPVINKPTRETENASLIDHILANDHSHLVLPGVINTDIYKIIFHFFISKNALPFKSHK